MIELVSKEACTGCYACCSACPTESISFRTDGEGFFYPVINRETCIECGLCTRCCPVMQTAELPQRPPRAYGAINRSEEERFRSSSGGIFTLLARSVIEKGGIVCGTAFDETWKLRHRGITKEEEIPSLCGSKYVQSQIGNCFREIRQHLEENRKVLFVGTPCQAAGLEAYLKGFGRENLLLVDLICHGVPSPGVWEKYLGELAQGRGLVEEINFRYKRHGWENLYFLARFGDAGGEICQPAEKNAYLQGFLRNLTLRPSCYDCAFKTVGHISDLTLADFWGVRHVLPAFYDNRGCSLVLVHTQAGERALEEIADQADLQEVDLSAAIGHNTALTQSVSRPAQREVFFQGYGSGGEVTALLEVLCRETAAEKCTRMMKRMIRVVKRFCKRAGNRRSYAASK